MARREREESEVRINVSPAAHAKGPILAAEQELAKKLRAETRKWKWTGTINLDFIPDEGHLAVEGFTPRPGGGDTLFSIWVTGPAVDEDDGDDGELNAEIIGNSEKPLVAKIKEFVLRYEAGEKVNERPYEATIRGEAYG